MLSVIGTYAAVPNSAERQSWIYYMYQGIVNGPASKRIFLYYFFAE